VRPQEGDLTEKLVSAIPSSRSRRTAGSRMVCLSGGGGLQ